MSFSSVEQVPSSLVDREVLRNSSDVNHYPLEQTLSGLSLGAWMSRKWFSGAATARENDDSRFNFYMLASTEPCAVYGNSRGARSPRRKEIRGTPGSSGRQTLAARMIAAARPGAYIATRPRQRAR